MVELNKITEIEDSEPFLEALNAKMAFTFLKRAEKFGISFPRFMAEIVFFYVTCLEKHIETLEDMGEEEEKQKALNLIKDRLFETKVG